MSPHIFKALDAKENFTKSEKNCKLVDLTNDVTLKKVSCSDKKIFSKEKTEKFTINETESSASKSSVKSRRNIDYTAIKDLEDYMEKSLSSKSDLGSHKLDQSFSNSSKNQESKIDINKYKKSVNQLKHVDIERSSRLSKYKIYETNDTSLRQTGQSSTFLPHGDTTQSTLHEKEIEIQNIVEDGGLSTVQNLKKENKQNFNSVYQISKFLENSSNRIRREDVLGIDNTKSKLVEDKQDIHEIREEKYTENSIFAKIKDIDDKIDLKKSQTDNLAFKKSYSGIKSPKTGEIEECSLNELAQEEYIKIANRIFDSYDKIGLKKLCRKEVKIMLEECYTNFIPKKVI